MPGPSRFALAIAGGLLIVAADAVAQDATKPFSHTIRPRQIAEECVKLAPGQTIAYAFEASQPVDFNIHYHRGDEVVYPVEGDQVRQGEDRFTAPTAEEYCLMWTNRTLQMATVKGRLTR